MSEPSWWTEDRVTELRMRWAAGESGSEIRRAMGAKSRNAVVGKVYRLQLGGRAPVHHNNGVKPVSKRRRTVHYVDGRMFIKGDDVIEPEPPIMTNPKLLLELKDRDCRWPGSGTGAQMLYCGAPALKGQSYCLYHCRVAYAGAPRVRMPPR